MDLKWDKWITSLLWKTCFMTKWYWLVSRSKYSLQDLHAAAYLPSTDQSNAAAHHLSPLSQLFNRKKCYPFKAFSLFRKDRNHMGLDLAKIQNGCTGMRLFTVNYVTDRAFYPSAWSRCRIHGPFFHKSMLFFLSLSLSLIRASLWYF